MVSDSFSLEKKNLDAVLQPGMVITDEPGVYVPGKYGSYAEIVASNPHFDLDGVDLSLFNEKEKQLLTDYQQFKINERIVGHTLTL